MSELTHALLVDLLNRPGPLWLVGIDLSEINLNQANLKGARLAEANLHHVRLQRADVGNADLSDANWTGAFLGEANLAWTNPTGARLSHGNLADLTGANLDEAQLCQATMPDETVDA